MEGPPEPGLSCGMAEPVNQQEEGETERHLLEEQRGKINGGSGSVPPEARRRVLLGPQKHPKSQQAEERASHVLNQGNPCNHFNMQRMQRPEEGAGKRRQLVLEELTAKPVHDPNAECVKAEMEKVGYGRINAGSRQTSQK